jgi:hypothetical protein
MSQLVNGILPIVAIFVAYVLLKPRIRDAPWWQATVTPLASIIGSGFLVIAPLLGQVAGAWAVWAMLLIVVIAYGIGAIVRFNIRYAEPLLESGKASAGMLNSERISNVALSIAYVISVAFYLRLLSAFILRAFHVQSDMGANLLTTFILLFIGVTGWRRGLKALERLEEYSVTIKLSIIVALLLGLAYFDFSSGFSANGLKAEPHDLFESLRMLAGMLLVVQGFETSRYLGSEYGAAMRIRSMRLAQWIAGIIYIAFVLLITPLLFHLPVDVDETAIIELAGYASASLPLMLVIAAVMSQFSAAVADTLGAGGLVAEETRHAVTPQIGYLGIALLACILVWSTNIFDIITLASRAFAAYYLAQALLALQIAARLPAEKSRWLHLCQFGLSSVVLAWIVVYAMPAG